VRPGTRRASHAAALLAIAACSPDAPAEADGRLLPQRTDTLAIYLVRGSDTVRSGRTIDELRVVEENGRMLLHRIFRTEDDRLGTRVDTLVDEQLSLAPVRQRSGSQRTREVLEFGDGRVRGWLRIERGDSVPVDVAIGDSVRNASSFDLVIRASPLADGWEATVPAFLPNTRNVVPMRAVVGGSEEIGGRPTWRVEADFAGMPVIFWIDKATRAIRRQVIRMGPDAMVLYDSVPRD
jgi:hypothetical protein